ncbi:MAG: hypothetical protein Kow0037_19370 [Calditrichia bacterium]
MRIYFLFLLVFVKSIYAQQLSFTDVAQQLGVSQIDYAYGCAWGDYDNDNDIDLYVTSYAFSLTGPQNLNNLFRNDINTTGIFVDVATQMGVEESYTASRGATWCDFNNNGILDLYATVNSYSYPDSSKLFVNKITHFDNQGGRYRVSNWGHHMMPCWGDYDNDGDQDLYLVIHTPSRRNKLYRNDGDFFTNVTNLYNVKGGGNGGSANWVDFDNDGDLDIYVYNSNDKNILYENRIDENNTFVDVSMFYAVNDSGKHGGSIWFDYDNDGDQDLFLANEININFPHLSTPSKMYQNNINISNQFVEVTNILGIGDSISSISSTVGDYDNDGDLDLYVGVPYGPNKYFRNDYNVNGTFSETALSLNIDDTLSSVGLVSGDYDNDGDLDIYALNAPRETCRLYRNNLNSSDYLSIRLLDREGNFNRFGSSVKVYFSGTDCLVGMRAVDGGGSGQRTQNAYDCHFGLDPNQAYDIEVIFTTRTNGQNHVFNKYNRPELGNVIPAQVGHFLEIRDSVVTVTAIQPGEKPQTIKSFKLYQNYPNPFNSGTTISFQIEKHYRVKLIIYDLTGKEVITLTNQYYNRGFYEINWNGKYWEGGDVASGVYICNFLLDNKLQDVRKMFLIR